MPDMHVTITVGPTAPTIPGDAVKSFQRTVGQANQDRILHALRTGQESVVNPDDYPETPDGDFDLFTDDLVGMYQNKVARDEKRTAKAAISPDPGLIS